MNTKGTIQNLLDELVAGNPHSDVIQAHMDVILTWLARPDSEKVEEFRNAYSKRNISEGILRGYVLFILEQKLFSDENLTAHQVLALPYTATKEQIKSRYQKLIRIYHPDRGIGDARILHQHAEKINQAYQKLTTNNVSSKANPHPSYTVKTSTVVEKTDRADSFVDTVMTRKLRSKLGNAKRFQIIFFGAVASFCLLLILLIYIQPETVDSARSYSKKNIFQNELIDQTSAEMDQLEAESVKDLAEDNAFVLSNDFENTAPVNNDFSSSEQTVESSIIEPEQLPMEVGTSDQGPLEAVELTNEKSRQELAEQADDIGFIDNPDPTKTEDKIDTQITSLLTQDSQVQTSQVEQKPILSEQVSSAEEKPISTKKAELISDQAEQDSSVVKKSVKETEPEIVSHSEAQTSFVRKASDDKQKSSSNQATKQQSNKSEKPAQNIVEIEVVESKKVTKKVVDTQSTSQPVQVEEIQVAKIVKPRQNYDKANLFERRFARRFVVRYLESIEQGNISLINDFLSENLAINGVSNNKHSHLKNTTQMITNSDKVSYRINFVGDVLRLDKGSFRVTLKEHQTVIFKNNRKTQTSSTKSYDIKRYSYGSEIVSISDV